MPIIHRANGLIQFKDSEGYLIWSSYVELIDDEQTSEDNVQVVLYPSSVGPIIQVSLSPDPNGREFIGVTVGETMVHHSSSLYKIIKDFYKGFTL